MDISADILPLLFGVIGGVVFCAARFPAFLMQFLFSFGLAAFCFGLLLSSISLFGILVIALLPPTGIAVFSCCKK